MARPTARSDGRQGQAHATRRPIRRRAAVLAAGVALAAVAAAPATAAREAAAAPSAAQQQNAIRGIAASLDRVGVADGYVLSPNADGSVTAELPRSSVAALSDVAARAAAAYGVGLSVRSIAAAPRPAACSGDYCTPPLRAGIRIHSGSGSCTSGFVSRSRSDGLYYLMTAGHCGVIGSNWHTFFPDGSAHVIGRVHNRTFGGPGDYSIIRVNNVSGWSPRGWIYVRAGADSTRNEAYPVRRVGGSSIGMRICKSGATTDTTCGRVNRLGVTVNYGGTTVHDLGEANLCVRPGDSGGPVFASGTAYGLVSGYLPNTCRSFYQGASGAANALRVRIVTE